MIGNLLNKINKNIQFSLEYTTLGMFMARFYKKHPMIEAVCEFNFSEDIKGDSTVVGRYYEKIKDDFPIKNTKTKSVCDGMKEGCADVKKYDFTVFSNNKKNFDIGISERKLVIRAIKPYPSWKEYKKAIIDCFFKLNEIVSTRDCMVEFYYNNLIQLSNKEIYSPAIISNYFNFIPDAKSDELPNKWSEFIVGFKHNFPRKNSVCRTTLSSLQSEKNTQQNYLLCITISSTKPLIPSKIMTWIDKSHKNIYDIFEGCVTDNLRDTFDSVE